MKKFLIALLLTAACFAAPQLQVKYGEYQHHRYLYFRCNGPLELLTEWPKGYVTRVTESELILQLPDDLPYVPELVWLQGKEVFTTEAFEIPAPEGPQ